MTDRPSHAEIVERTPSNAELIASLQVTALLFRMFSLDELREMQARKDQA